MSLQNICENHCFHSLSILNIDPLGIVFYHLVHIPKVLQAFFPFSVFNHVRKLFNNIHLNNGQKKAEQMSIYAIPENVLQDIRWVSHIGWQQWEQQAFTYTIMYEGMFHKNVWQCGWHYQQWSFYKETHIFSKTDEQLEQNFKISPDLTCVWVSVTFLYFDLSSS